MGKHALVTLQIGSNAVFEAVNENFRATCKRLGWSFEIISKRKLGFVPVWKKIRRIQFEKFQIGQLLEKYERILYLDSDILINPSLPNIFEIVSEANFGCVMEDVGPLKWKRAEERERAQKKLGPVEDWNDGYFNSGMFVVSQRHRPLFSTKWKDIVGGRWPDQTTLNYQVRSHGFEIQALPITFNYLPELCEKWNDSSSRGAAHIVHYAGPEAKAAMRKDLESHKNETD